MFTGLVDHVAEIVALEKEANQMKLTLQTEFKDLIWGESIAVDGVCLTALSPSKDGKFSCEVSPETISRSRASLYSLGAKTNVERALKLGDRLGGHVVQGHVDTQAILKHREPQGDYWELGFHTEHPSAQKYLLAKGSISVNGVSLTLNRVGHQDFSVMIIPHTWRQTNLHLLELGESVNLEFDWLIKVFLNAYGTQPKN